MADLDGAGGGVVVVGGQLFDMAGADVTPPALGLGVGGTLLGAVGDLDGDRMPEVVLAAYSNSVLGAFELSGNRFLLGPVRLAHPGPPVVGDVDGDQADVIVCTDDGVVALSSRCQQPAEAGCADASGLLWSRALAPPATGGSPFVLFDFNGDGRQEIAYRDDCWLRFLDAVDGEVLFALAMSSTTIQDGAVIADVDQDGHADLVVPSSLRAARGN